MTHTTEEICRRYDSVAPCYRAVEQGLELLIGPVRRRMAGKARGCVLDAATGTGLNLVYFPSDCNITAIDLSQGMLNFARKRAEKLGRTVQFHLMNTLALDFQDDMFDTVCDVNALCTFVDPLKALAEMKRVCKPPGQLLLLEHGISESPLVKAGQNALSEFWESISGCTSIGIPKV